MCTVKDECFSFPRLCLHTNQLLRFLPEQRLLELSATVLYVCQLRPSPMFTVRGCIISSNGNFQELYIMHTSPTLFGNVAMATRI